MSKSRKPLGNSDPLTNNPFAGLGGLREEVSGEAESPSPDAPPTPSSTPAERVGSAALTGKLVVRKEKKGRRGKGVTVIEGVQGRPEAREALLARMRKALGCGGSIEGSNLVLSGAQVGRVATWLRDEGARRVVEGN